jgi:hypothetical protein
MPELDQLPQRFDNYSALVENIVIRGIEHPRCELKRQVAISETGDRFEFIKLLQGLANSHSDGECLIVIGADEENAKFVQVENVDDFDKARLSPMFSKFLDPEPLYEIFKQTASTGEQYILFVLNPLQPRPIMALVDGKTEAKGYFRPGDIWIKHNTGLRPAKKADLDQMYEPVIDREAAKRARTVIEHLKQELGAANIAPDMNPIPAEDALVASRASLRHFVKGRLAAKEPVPFNMLLEMARNSLVVKWNKTNSGHFSIYGVNDEEHEAFLSAYSAEYLPVLQSVIDMGLSVIMYEGPLDWHKRVIDLLVEAFESASQLGRLAAFRDAEANRAYQPNMFPDRAEGYQITPLAVGRPAYEVYLGARVLATYATMRKRSEYLTYLLSRFVHTATEDRHRDTVQPILFWPFSGDLGLPPMTNGRNEDFWQQRVSLSWAEEFGSKEMFLGAAAGLELILELNSHLFVYDTDPDIKEYKDKNPTRRYEYLPDFWKSPLDFALPTAQWLYEKLLTEKRFPGIVSLASDIVQKIFADKPAGARAVFFGEFLFRLKKWQGEVMLQQQRFPFHFAWPEPLDSAVEKYKATLPPKTPSH